jgi:predicted DNA-binding protein
MTKDQNFKMRLDERDRERLETLAEHYSVPAASVVRILLKREADAIAREALTAPNPRRTKIKRGGGGR